MASGYFPLDKTDPNGKKLREAIRLIKEVFDALYADGSDTSQYPEDILANGVALGGLDTAIDLIDRTVR